MQASQQGLGALWWGCTSSGSPRGTDTGKSVAPGTRQRLVRGPAAAVESARMGWAESYLHSPLPGLHSIFSRCRGPQGGDLQFRVMLKGQPWLFSWAPCGHFTEGRGGDRVGWQCPGQGALGKSSQPGTRLTDSLTLLLLGCRGYLLPRKPRCLLAARVQEAQQAVW